MNKRVGSSKYLNSKNEDKEIKDVAYASNVNSRFVFGMVIFAAAMFLVTMMFSLLYYTKMSTDAYKIIEKRKDNNRVFITTNGSINERVKPNMFNTRGEYSVIREASIELVSSPDEKEKPVISFDVKYNILNNTFNKSGIASNDSEVVVRFSYSYDKKDWIYINNVISTDESTLNTLMGNYFDIAGITGNLNISTNNKMEAEIGKSNIMYWRCETVFQNIINKQTSGLLNAEFIINYNE